MKIYCVSDTHQKHKELNIPECDIAIFCGDMSNSFELARNTVQCRDFLEWYNKLQIKTKILIAGNHDRAIEHKWILPSDYPNLHWLFNETKVIDGLKIFGSPYTPVYGEWSYVYNRKDANKYWDCIEEGTDIVITHGSPKGILDLAEDQEDRSKIVQVGCKTLANKIAAIKPRLHCFGHLHSIKKKGINNNGVYFNGVTTSVNASCLDHGDNSFSNGYLFNYENNSFSPIISSKWS